MRFRFGECELDLERMELCVRGTVQPVEPQVFDVLTVLLRNRDRVVSKDELMDTVWRHRFVTESSLSSRIKSARRAVGDDGRAQRLIRTVHGRGYQFVGDVRTDQPGSTSGRGPAPVPRPATPTIGRSRDIDAVCELLRTARVVTLLGPGGVGKTRLAAEVALRHEPAATCFVDLTKVRDHALVPGLIAHELGVHVGSSTGSRQTLEEAVRGFSGLLVLDNVEHVIDSVEIVSAIVQWSGAVRILATSRARLRIAGEHIYDVAPLALEPSDTEETGMPDAVALFNQAATAIDPGFHLDLHLSDVAAICRTLDGLPLAVELAAGHIRTLPPAQLRTRLSTQLRSALGAARDLPSRQQTIPAMIDWSLALLGDSERRLFAQFGVFAGPVALEAVERVCEPADGRPVLESLSRLVDQSMVRRVAGSPGGEPRFTLLELLRERARQLLVETGDATAAAARHAGYVADRCEDIDERKWTDLSDRWIDGIAELLPEIRAAQLFAQERDPVLAARITASLGSYWLREGHHREGRQWIEAALGGSDRFEAGLVARLHLAAGLLEFSADRLTARPHLEKAIAAFRESGHDRNLAYSLAAVAATHIGEADSYRSAVERCDEAITLARRVGELPLIAQALNIKGELSRVQGYDHIALDVYQESLELAAAANDRAHMGILVANLAYLAEHRGDHAEARRLAQESIRICWGLGRRMMVAWSVSELAGPELALGRPERGARLVGAADEALRLMGLGRQPGDVSEHARVLMGLEAALGPERFRHLRAEGADLSLDEAVALALADPEKA